MKPPGEDSQGRSLGELAAALDCELHGDASRRVQRVGTLRDSGPDALSFLANPAYRSLLGETSAGAVILAPGDLESCPVDALVCTDPHAAFARVAMLLHPPPPRTPGVNVTATVAPGCSVPPSCEIGPGVVLGADVKLGERVAIGANAVIGSGVRIGADTRIGAGTILESGVRVGMRCVIHSGAVIGADGFGFARQGEGWIKVPQVGGVVIGDDVEIGALTTVDRGAIGDTVIHDGVKLDNLIQVAHNVEIGAHTAIAALTGISGSARIGARCMIGGQSGIAGHISIADDVMLGGRSIVASSIRKAGTYGGGGAPVAAFGLWRKNAIRMTQLDEMARRLRRLEKQFAGLGDGGEKEQGR